MTYGLNRNFTDRAEIFGPINLVTKCDTKLPHKLSLMENVP